MNAHGALPFNFGDTMSRSEKYNARHCIYRYRGAVVFSSRAKRKKMWYCCNSNGINFGVTHLFLDNCISKVSSFKTISLN